ncbi:MAG: hypothetical protein IIW86_03545, partial [Clostridia bacterium]|nr:hypothetical protein [Clostridia bacterium]MBQ5900918.1 hypothetical protein [Clostridia bacterium]
PTFSRPDEIDVRAWTEILSGYSQTDILDALKEYRKNVPYDKAPNPATFKGYLPEREHTTAAPAEDKIELPSPEKFMDEDVQANNCRNNLYVYRDAFDICLNDFLLEVVPADVVERAKYPKNVQLALENGVFNRFGEAMLIAAHRRFGENRDYEFPSKNDMLALKQQGKAPAQYSGDAIKTLSAHWSAL